MSGLASRLGGWALDSEGSSRSCGLIRIGLVWLLWARFGRELVLTRDPASPDFVALSLCFFGTTTWMLVGYRARLAAFAAGAVVAVMVFYVGAVLGRPGWGHHHADLLATATLLCALTPCGRSYSLDRWLALRRAERGGPPPPPECGNLWALRLMALQLSLIYLWSAIDKTTIEFLSGHRLEVMFVRYYAGADYVFPSGARAAAAMLGWATVLLEYSLAFGLLFRRTRRWLVIPGLLFHGVLYLTLPVLTFSLTVALLYLAYFDADSVARLLDRLHGAPAGSGAHRRS